MSAMSTLPTPPPRLRQTVHVLHRWDSYTGEETGVFRTYASALASLATTLRAGWQAVAHRDNVPADPTNLSDAETVLAYYGGDGGDGGRETPTFGVNEASEAGFELIETTVRGPETCEVSLRLATLRVHDGDPDDPDAVTYYLDAEGLTIAVTAGPSGYPHVRITPESYLSTSR